jgi:hypothetical protein
MKACGESYRKCINSVDERLWRKLSELYHLCWRRFVRAAIGIVSPLWTKPCGESYRNCITSVDGGLQHSYPNCINFVKESLGGKLSELYQFCGRRFVGKAIGVSSNIPKLSELNELCWRRFVGQPITIVLNLLHETGTWCKCRKAKKLSKDSNYSKATGLYNGLDYTKTVRYNHLDIK